MGWGPVDPVLSFSGKKIISSCHMTDHCCRDREDLQGGTGMTSLFSVLFVDEGPGSFSSSLDLQMPCMQRTTCQTLNFLCDPGE